MYNMSLLADGSLERFLEYEPVFHSHIVKHCYPAKDHTNEFLERIMNVLHWMNQSILLGSSKMFKMLMHFVQTNRWMCFFINFKFTMTSKPQNTSTTLMMSCHFLLLCYFCIFGTLICNLQHHIPFHFQEWCLIAPPNIALPMSLVFDLFFCKNQEIKI